MRQRSDKRDSETSLGERHADHPAQHIVLRRLNLDSKLLPDRRESRVDRRNLGREPRLDGCDIGPGGNFFAQGLIQTLDM
jgi:hypothetical protein